MTCHCFIKHATTPDERASAAASLEEPRELGDTNGTIIALAALTGDCPAKPGPGKSRATKNRINTQNTTKERA